MTLVEGASAAGKSVICQHLAFGALMSGHHMAYFTSEHTARSLTNQMGAIGLDVSKYVSTGQLEIYPLKEPIQGEDSGPMLAALALDMDRLPKRCQFVVVDAITNLAGYSQEPDIITFFSALRRQCSRGRTIAVVAHSYAFTEGVFIRLGDLCDAHFRLRTGKVRSKFVRMLEVTKANGTDLDRDNLMVFEVEPGTGVRIFPMSQARV